MRFAPKTEKEIIEAGLWPDGEYAFEIIGTEERLSKAGNEMIVLKIKVYNDDGASIFVDDYLLEAMAFKLRHAAECCGLLPEYESGSLNAGHFEWQKGRLKLKTQKSKDDAYADRNVVADYIVGAKTEASPRPISEILENEKIPF